MFDQNERYNIFLEETIWTKECARQIKDRNKHNDIIDYVLNIIQTPVYEGTFNKLCGKNVVLFKKIINNQPLYRPDMINMKIRIFVNSLRSAQ